ncbi:MAG TPA: hypothetical protein VN915_01425 [Elusimicrobiota bacterium]|nr:hypothetical protein [Elusimicrobiota bacterium]
MKNLGLALALMAFAASSVRAAIDPKVWKDWKAEDARVEQRILDAFPKEPYHSESIDHINRERAFAADIETTVSSAAMDDRVAIAQAKVSGALSADEAEAELARLDKALAIHLCYLYGSIMPRGYGNAFGKFVSASLRARLQDRISRDEYLALLRQDPMQGTWRSGAGRNLSELLLPEMPDHR